MTLKSVVDPNPPPPPHTHKHTLEEDKFFPKPRGRTVPGDEHLSP